MCRRKGEKAADLPKSKLVPKVVGPYKFVLVSHMAVNIRVEYMSYTIISDRCNALPPHLVVPPDPPLLPPAPTDHSNIITTSTPPLVEHMYPVSDQDVDASATTMIALSDTPNV